MEKMRATKAQYESFKPNRVRFQECENAEVSLANASEVSVTGGTVTQVISDTTITVEFTPDLISYDLFDPDPSVTINNGVITMTGGGNQVFDPSNNL